MSGQPPGGGPYPPPPGGSYPPPPPGQQPWSAPPGQAPWQPPRYGGPPTVSAPRAGFGARLASVLIDGLILGAFGIVGAVVLIAGPKSEELCSVDSSGEIVVDGPNNAICEVPSGAAWAAAIAVWVIGFVVALAYVGILQGKRGATWGQQAAGIRTVDQYSGQPIGPGRAIGRYFAGTLSAIPCYLGFLWMLWDEQRQTWHDKIVGSVVVRS